MLNFGSFAMCSQWKVRMMRLDECLHMLNMPQGPDGSTWVIWHSSGWPTLQNFEAIHWLRRHMRQQCESQSKLQYAYIMFHNFGIYPWWLLFKRLKRIWFWYITGTDKCIASIFATDLLYCFVLRTKMQQERNPLHSKLATHIKPSQIFNEMIWNDFACNLCSIVTFCISCNNCPLNIFHVCISHISNNSFFCCLMAQDCNANYTSQ